MGPHDRIRDEYLKSHGDAITLFQTVLSVAGEIGTDAALQVLERCVIEKRLAWLDQHLATLERSRDPVADGYRIFYEEYLGLSMPGDGEEVEATEGRLVTRWWNECPTLEACKELGLHTREICRKAYHRPVQAFLSRIDPRLRFDRNYDALRPHTPYCEEMIMLEEVDRASGPSLRMDTVEIKVGPDLPLSQLLDLYDSVGWAAYTHRGRRDKLGDAIRRSTYVVSAWKGDRLVGLARGLSDDVSIFYLQDILVHPDHQRQGIGRQLLSRCLERFEHVRTKVLLTDGDEKQLRFYAALGFKDTSSLTKLQLTTFVQIDGVDLD